MKLVVLGIFCSTLISCSKQVEENVGLNANPEIQKDTFQHSISNSKPKSFELESGLSKGLKLVGDFNGDRKGDTIYESYTSKLTGKETTKEFEADDYEQEVEKIIANQPVCKIRTSIPYVSLFLVTDEPQQTGIAEFENLGDLNNDGSDEIGYVIKWADFSNLNSYHIITISGNGFKEIYSFPINEAVNSEEENLFQNKSIIQKTGLKKFKHKFYNEEAEVEEKEVTLE